MSEILGSAVHAADAHLPPYKYDSGVLLDEVGTLRYGQGTRSYRQVKEESSPLSRSCLSFARSSTTRREKDPRCDLGPFCAFDSEATLVWIDSVVDLVSGPFGSTLGLVVHLLGSLFDPVANIYSSALGFVTGGLHILLRACIVLSRSNTSRHAYCHCGGEDETT